MSAQLSQSLQELPIRLQKLVHSRAKGLSRRRQETQFNLLRAAANLYAEQGINGTTVEEISEAAGYTRGAFYSNFRNLDDLLIVLLETEYNYLIERIDRARELIPKLLPKNPSIAGQAQATPELADFADHWIQTLPLTRQDVLLRSELASHAIRSETFRKPFVIARTQLVAAVTRFLQEGMPIIKVEPVIEVEEISQIMVSLVERASKNQLVKDPHGTQLNEVSAQMLLPVLRGLLRPAP